MFIVYYFQTLIDPVNILQLALEKL